MRSVHCVIMISNKKWNKSHEWISEGGWEVNIVTTITIQHQNRLVSLMYFWTASIVISRKLKKKKKKKKKKKLENFYFPTNIESTVYVSKLI